MERGFIRQHPVPPALHLRTEAQAIPEKELAGETTPSSCCKDDRQFAVSCLKAPLCVELVPEVFGCGHSPASLDTIHELGHTVALVGYVRGSEPPPFRLRFLWMPVQYVYVVMLRAIAITFSISAFVVLRD